MQTRLPPKQGLYDPSFEHDACGIGFVADIKGRKSHDIVLRGLEVLIRMEHRGAESADNKTGDGAGILMQMPDAFFRAEVPSLPDYGQYGAGLVFLPQNTEEAGYCLEEFERIIVDEGLRVILWRDVPVDNAHIGDIARLAEPAIKQVFIGSQEPLEQDALERKLYVIRKLVELRIRNSALSEASSFYLPSLSTKTIVYKGMFMASQIQDYYQDLQDSRIDSAIALVHSRFSTNTFPTWELAQPFRIVAHNGEINTLKGNRFWLQARGTSLKTPILGDDIQKIMQGSLSQNAATLLLSTTRLSCWSWPDVHCRIH